jgi:ubiquinone/menaquinone biosynthesis C-methylase UbiE
MDSVTKHHPHDYLPAAGHDAFLPGYDPLSRLLGLNRVHQELIVQAELGDGQRVLEIGCGTGNLTIRAQRAQPGATVIGSDPDPRALDRAQRKATGLSGIRFERAYAQRLPYADGEFDRVLSSMMLHHLDHDVKPAAADEVFRVLRRGGRLHLVDITDRTGEPIPRLLRSAGFDCTEVATRRQRIIGRLTYYQATRPA